MTLRPVHKSDIETLATWLPKIAAGAGCKRWASEAALPHALAGAGALVSDDCFLAYRAGTPLPRAAKIEFLAVPPGRRRLGIGSRAALAIEKQLRRSVDGIYVAVPARLGLALYFWLRLGYRPLLQPDSPSRLDDASVWMMRKLR
jgi:GNAT superfamily N-acetyltransferase